MLQLPPLSLYIHIPWCVQKCPYCDFNSHGNSGELPQQAYMAALLEDLEQDLKWVQGRALTSIFFGGGTPSLIEPAYIGGLLAEIKKRVVFAPDIEITLEANPGTVEAARFAGFYAAGINRISIGVQSFEPEKLQHLGRIHNQNEAKNAVNQALAQPFNSVNMDLMFGLPNQTINQALADLHQAIALGTPHLSWYQLTIEPNTAFFSQPPVLPDDDLIWQMFEQGKALLEAAGYRQYEVSAWAKAGYQCRHNLNYWRFGDYLGIGCGSHGKITCPEQDEIIRTVKVKHPKGYLTAEKPYLFSQAAVASEQLQFEYFLNRMRLFEPMPKAEFSLYTNQPIDTVKKPLQWGIDKGLVTDEPSYWHLTQQGRRFVNSLLEQFI